MLLSRGKVFALILCVFTSTLFLCACGQRETPAEKFAQEDCLVLGNGSDPATLDPSLATGTTEYKILNSLFEGLVTANTATLKIEPAVARTWEISDDGLKYTFKIDPKSKWSDGKQVSAKDFEFAWKRILSPQLGAEYASMLFVIKNAKDYNTGILKDSNKVGVRAIDNFTLEVELEKPTPYFLSLLYHFAYFPLPQHILKKFNADTTRDAQWTKPQNMVSNGAFTLKKWSINDRIEVVKNQKYRAIDKIFLNKIIFLPIQNINTEDRAFRAEQLHITESIAPSRLDNIRNTALQTLRQDKWIGVYYYQINSSRPPLDNPKVRKALSMTINRQAIINSFLKAGQPPAFALIPEGCGAYKTKESAKITEDINLAKKLLSEAGYPNGKNFPTIRITYNTSEQHKPIAEAIQQMWKEHLGINAELFNLSWPAFLSARRTKDFDIARASWIGDYASPETFLEIFQSQSGLNHSGYANKLFDENFELARASKTDEMRFKHLADAEAQLLDDLPIIPIYFYSKVFRISPLVEGWHSNILDYRNYHNVKLRKRRDVK